MKGAYHFSNVDYRKYLWAIRVKPEKAEAGPGPKTLMAIWTRIERWTQARGYVFIEIEWTGRAKDDQTGQSYVLILFEVMQSVPEPLREPTALLARLSIERDRRPVGLAIPLQAIVEQGLRPEREPEAPVH